MLHPRETLRELSWEGRDKRGKKGVVSQTRGGVVPIGKNSATPLPRGSQFEDRMGWTATVREGFRTPL
jgi:hypothetical protein